MVQKCLTFELVNSWMTMMEADLGHRAVEEEPPLEAVGVQSRPQWD